MDISKIVFGQQLTLDMPVDEVLPEGVEKITALLEKSGNDDMRRYIRYNEYFPKGWSWRWTEVHGPWVGNLPKRIQSHAYKVFRRQLPSEVVSEIGNIAKDHTNKHTTWVYDFDKTLNWNAGDFGDEGSCFWTEKPWCLPILREIGGFALRVYDPETRERGIGRGLVIPYDPVKELGRDYLSELYTKGKIDELLPKDDNPPILVVFNGYGQFRKDYVNERGKRYGHMQSMDYARILAQILGQSYHKATLSFNHSYTDPIYVNNDGSSSFLVGPDPLVRKLGGGVDIEISSGVVSRHRQTCINCGRSAVNGPATIGRRAGRLAPNGDLYCTHCFDKMFAKCFGCETLVEKDHNQQVYSLDGNFFGCAAHRDKISRLCSVCGSQWARVEMTRITGKRDVCPNCLRIETRNCYSCKRRFLMTELTPRVDKNDPLTQGRPARVCKHCLGQQEVAAKKRGVSPKYLPLPGNDQRKSTNFDKLLQHALIMAVDYADITAIPADDPNRPANALRYDARLNLAPPQPGGFANEERIELVRRMLAYNQLAEEDGMPALFRADLGMTVEAGRAVFADAIGVALADAIFNALHVRVEQETMRRNYAVLRDHIQQYHQRQAR